MLAQWKLGGWVKLVGRHPGPDDLILPAFYPKKETWTFRHKMDGWKEQRDDLKTLGLRHRRQHDFRRTFISLARADGADKDILKWITHGAPTSEIMDVYTTFPWESLCKEVAGLKISCRENRVISLQKTATISRDADTNCYISAADAARYSMKSRSKVVGELGFEPR